MSLLGPFDARSWARLGARLRKLESAVAYLMTRQQEATVVYPTADFIYDKFDRADADSLGAFWVNAAAFKIRNLGAVPAGTVTTDTYDFVSAAAATATYSAAANVDSPYGLDDSRDSNNILVDAPGAAGSSLKHTTTCWGALLNPDSLTPPFTHTSYYKARLNSPNYFIRIRCTVNEAVQTGTTLTDYIDGHANGFPQQELQNSYASIFNVVAPVWRFDPETWSGQFGILTFAHRVGASFSFGVQKSISASANSTGPCFDTTIPGPGRDPSSTTYTPYNITASVNFSVSAEISDASFVAGYAYAGTVGANAENTTSQFATLLTWKSFSTTVTNLPQTLEDEQSTVYTRTNHDSAVCGGTTTFTSSHNATVSAIAQIDKQEQSVIQDSAFGSAAAFDILVECVDTFATIYVDNILITVVSQDKLEAGMVGLHAIYDALALKNLATTATGVEIPLPVINSIKVWLASNPEPPDTAESGYGNWVDPTTVAEGEPSGYIYTEYVNP